MGDWLTAVLFFAVWGMFGAIFLKALDIAERFVRLPFPHHLGSVAVIAGALLATLVMLWLHCALFVSLPFADDQCKPLGF